MGVGHVFFLFGAQVDLVYLRRVCRFCVSVAQLKIGSVVPLLLPRRKALGAALRSR